MIVCALCCVFASCLDLLVCCIAYVGVLILIGCVCDSCLFEMFNLDTLGLHTALFTVDLVLTAGLFVFC